MIILVNHSTVVSDDEVKACASALNYQAAYHFRPAWGHSQAVGVKVPTGNHPTYRLFECGIFDDSDQAGALGYHDESGSGRVFAKTDQKYGLSWTITASHEVLEMMADIWTIAGCQYGTGNQWTMLEVCDAVEDDSLGYMVADVMVSDFVLPAWYSGAAGPWDYKRHLTAAGEIAPGGYIALWDPHTGWTQRSNGDGARSIYRDK